MDITEEVKTWPLPEQVIEDRLGAPFRPAGDDIGPQRLDGGWDVGAEDIDRTDLFEEKPHLVIGHLSLRLERGGGSAAGEPKPNPLDFHYLSVDVLETVWQVVTKTPRSIDIPVDDEPTPPVKCHRHFSVLGVDSLADLRSHVIEMPGGRLGPEISHPLIITGGSCCGRLTSKLQSEDICHGPLPRPVVGQVHQITEDDDRLAHCDDPTQRIQREMNVGNSEDQVSATPAP